MIISRCAYFILLLSLFSNQLLIGQVNVIADREDATYEVGETMTFEVTSTVTGPLTYDIRYDTYAPSLKHGTTFIYAGGKVEIPFTANDPSFVMCTVNVNGQESKAAAGFSPFDICQTEDEPADFDAFWAEQRAQLNAVPIDPVITFKDSTLYSKTYRVNLANIDNRRVYGYLTVPNGPGPFPAIMTLPPYGTLPNIVIPQDIVAEVGGALSFSVSQHNAEPDAMDPNAEMPNDPQDQYTNYYRYVLLGAVRAIDYLFTRPDFNGMEMGVTGVSQGGGLSIIMAGLDQRVNLLVNSTSGLSDHAGLKHERSSGFPFYFWTNPDKAAIVAATKYYDAVNFAKRYDGPSLTFVSFEDPIAPPNTIMASFNQLKGTKILLNSRELEHENANEYWSGRFDFFRKHFPSMITTPPRPFIPTTTGYFADAGNDISAAVNVPVTMNAYMEYNEVQNTTWPITWRVEEGPGAVSFSNPNSINTTATFDQAGTYLLSVKGEDVYDESDEKRYFIMDYITVVIN